MELQFKKAGHDYYEPLRFTPFSCETMRENIVPDSCAEGDGDGRGGPRL